MTISVKTPVTDLLAVDLTPCNSPAVKSLSVKSVDEMADFATMFAEKVQPGDTIFLNGNLGAGKTTFTQFLAKAIGVTESVTSPTYTISKEYTSGKLPLLHIDLYRITSDLSVNDDQSTFSITHLENTFYDEVLKTGIVVIEWGASIAKQFTPRYELSITRDAGKGDEYRLIEWRYVGALAESGVVESSVV